MSKIKEYAQDFLENGGYDLGYDENNLPKIKDMQEILKYGIPVELTGIKSVGEIIKIHKMDTEEYWTGGFPEEDEYYSNCCEVHPLGEISYEENAIGLCSECKEMAVFRTKLEE